MKKLLLILVLACCSHFCFGQNHIGTNTEIRYADDKGQPYYFKLTPPLFHQSHGIKGWLGWHETDDPKFLIKGKDAANYPNANVALKEIAVLGCNGPYFVEVHTEWSKDENRFSCWIEGWEIPKGKKERHFDHAKFCIADWDGRKWWVSFNEHNPTMIDLQPYP